MPCFEDGILYPFSLCSSSYILSALISTMFCEPLSAILNYFEQFYFFDNFIHNPCVTPAHPSPLPTLPIIPFKFMDFSLIIIDIMLLSLSTIKIKESSIFWACFRRLTFFLIIPVPTCSYQYTIFLMHFYIISKCLLDYLYFDVYYKHQVIKSNIKYGLFPKTNLIKYHRGK